MKKINLLLLVVAIACIITMFVLGYQGMHVSMAVPICIGIVFCTSTLVVILTDKRTVKQAVYYVDGYVIPSDLVDRYLLANGIHRPKNIEAFVSFYREDIIDFEILEEECKKENACIEKKMREEEDALRGTIV